MTPPQMRIVFLTGSPKEAGFLAEVGKVLRAAHDAECWYLTSRGFLARGEHLPGPERVAYWGYDEVEPPETIRRYVERYAEHNLSLPAFSDRILTRWSRDRALGVVVRFLKQWERFIRDNGINVVINYVSNTVLCQTAHIVCQDRGLAHWSINASPRLADTFVLSDTAENEMLWSEFLQAYEQPSTALTDEQVERVNQWVEQCLATKNCLLPVRKAGLKNILGAAYRAWKYRSFDEYERLELQKVIGPFFRRLPLSLFRYDPVDPGDLYLFFPMHITWDAQIAARNPLLTDQRYLAEIVARSLPYGYTLYVKEHMYNYGGTRLSELKAIRALSNTKLLPPEENSHELIRRSRGVVTINSTAGFEAILLNKPLLTFGRSFYSRYRRAYRVERINELPRLVQQMLNDPSEEAEAGQERLRFLCAAFSTVWPGSALSYKSYMGLAEDTGRDVTQTLAKSMHQKWVQMWNASPVIS